MTKEISSKKDGKGNVISLSAIPNDFGHLYYQVKRNNNLIWFFKAYNYLEDGITSQQIKAPYGISEGDYESILNVFCI